MKKKTLKNELRYKNFCLLKLFIAYTDLTYDEYLNFCDFDDEHEIFDCSSESSLEKEYTEDLFKSGYMTRDRYLAAEIAAAKNSLRDIRKIEPKFDLYAVGAI